MARTWAHLVRGTEDGTRPVGIDAELAADFAAMGVTVAADRCPDDGVIEVDQRNWDSVRAFLGCQTQWRVAIGFAGAVWLGLDYAAAEIVLRMIGGGATLADLQAMEMAALPILNEAPR